MLLLNTSSLSHGSSPRNLIATSKVAPPHISYENRSLPYQAIAGAIFSMSRVLTLVARSDCWASLSEVSVMSTFFWASTHSLRPFAPFSSYICFVPFSFFIFEASASGTTGTLKVPALSFRLLTTMSPRNSSTCASRSATALIFRSSGLSPMKPVLQAPSRKVGWFRRFRRKPMLVLTPVTFISLRALTALLHAPLNVRSCEQTFTSRES